MQIGPGKCLPNDPMVEVIGREVQGKEYEVGLIPDASPYYFGGGGDERFQKSFSIGLDTYSTDGPQGLRCPLPPPASALPVTRPLPPSAEFHFPCPAAGVHLQTVA
ncbi:hypothetical protein E5288_WYG000892 [Bos mutus]|uniref:Uncharacterized protein n=1 Tax=Bos mutus TaxID=72004 RepID=A0A6B0RHJ5_9CETA|nr:hypothetical protein [Bos mutus]